MGDYLSEPNWRGDENEEDHDCGLVLKMKKRPNGDAAFCLESLDDEMPSDIQLELMFSWMLSNWIKAKAKQYSCGLEKAMEIATQQMFICMPEKLK